MSQLRLDALKNELKQAKQKEKQQEKQAEEWFGLSLTPTLLHSFSHITKQERQGKRIKNYVRMLPKPSQGQKRVGRVEKE